MPRRPIPLSVRKAVLIESGYRCAVPTCRGILALDIHHIVEVSEGGPNNESNLLALCPTCHALYTRGTVSRDAINVWKTMLVALSHAFDEESISNLLFLKKTEGRTLAVSGDGVLKFSHLVASGLASFGIFMATGVSVTSGPVFLYKVQLTEKGNRIIDAWFSGDRENAKEALSMVPQG